MDYISRAALFAFYRICDWWDGLNERTQSIICVAILATVFAIGGMVEASAPGGMYY